MTPYLLTCFIPVHGVPFRVCSSSDKSRKKIFISPPRKSKKKKFNLTIGLLSLGIHAPEPGTEFRFELPAKFGVGKSKLGVPEHIYPEIKDRWLNFFFLIFEVAKLKFFFLTCHLLYLTNCCDVWCLHARSVEARGQPSSATSQGTRCCTTWASS